MNYRETLSYLYEQLPMFTRIGEKAYKSGLDNIIILCDRLGNPQQKIKSIHIAGTNGKGSTSHMLAAILQSAGYRTGLYTSPHLYDFRERIRINGQMIGEAEVVDFVDRILPLTIQPSFFEITVAMAFDHFVRHGVDIAVIETGLGGRLDSTNIIDPELSVITNIGWDHMNLLGNTLGEIAVEKAGIIKMHKPVVIGETIPESKQVFIDKAKKMEAPLILAEEEYPLKEANPGRETIDCRFIQKKSGKEISVQTGSAAIYQSINTRTVLAAVDVLRGQGYEIDETALHKGLLHFKDLTGLKGRWDILGRSPDIIAEVAHNKDGITKILGQLREQYPSSHYHFILGFVRDKDIDDILKLFPSGASYYFTNAHLPRALPHNELMEKSASFELKGKSFDDVNDALNAAKSLAAENDVIMICGSFFILSELKHR